MLITLRLLVLAGAAIMATAQPRPAHTAGAPADLPAKLRSTYLLGPDDQITVRAPDAEELNDKPIRIDMSGHIRLPMAGRIMAAGLTVEQLEAAITSRLKPFIKEPDVAVTVMEFRSQPVSVIGSVKTPGVQQLQGRKSLVEILSLAGGLAEDAGHSAKITRRMEWGRIPLASAVDDPSGRFSVATVNIQEIMAATNPAQNILIAPEDVISVPRAEMVYVIGQVPKPGGYILGEHETFSVLKALSLAGGIDHGASPQKARILRPVSGTANRSEIPVNLKTIMAGTEGDVALQAEDILFVPTSAPKKAMARAAEAAIQLTTGIVLYRR